MAALRDDRLGRQGRPAPAALPRAGTRPTLRVVHQPHRGAGLARLLPRRRFPFSRSDRSRGFFLYGLSEDGGLDDVEESLPACRSSASTRAEPPDLPVSCAISRYASASRSASTARGRTASSSAVGRPAHPAQHATMPPPARTPPETANRSYPVTSNNTLTFAE